MSSKSQVMKPKPVVKISLSFAESDYNTQYSVEKEPEESKHKEDDETMRCSQEGLLPHHFVQVRFLNMDDSEDLTPNVIASLDAEEMV